MRFLTRLTVIFACIVAAAAIPALELEVDDGSALSTPLKKATADVNRQIPKMQQSLDDAQAGDAAAAERVRLAFGPQAHIPTIRQNIASIDAGTMQVSSMVPGDVEKKRGKINAFTPFDYRASGAHPLTTRPVEFGKLFNSGSPKGKTNAATVLHEAAHVFAHASDDHYTTGTNNMVPLGLALTPAQAANVRHNGGYAAEDPVVGSKNNPITEDRLDPQFRALRDSATNMHMNADSYALFGAVCDEQMARRQKRALLEDDPVAYFLAKRGAASCKLPPDYFKNRAAAKAAKEKAAATSKTGVVKAMDKNAAGVRSVAQKTVKGGKAPADSKSALKMLEKATKPTLPKMSKAGLSKGSLKGSKAKVPTSLGKLSNSKTSKLLSKAAKGTLKGSMSKSLKAKASKAKTASPLSKTSKSTRAKSVKGNASKASSKKAVKSKASKLGSSRAVTNKASKSKVSSANRSSLKKAADGSAKEGGARGAKQRKKSSTRSTVSRGKQTSKQSSKLSGPKLSKATSSKATSARKAAAVRPNAGRTKDSTPAQKATKASAAPKVAKPLSKSVVDPLKVAAPPKKKNGKP